jgi:hypothetical protein
MPADDSLVSVDTHRGGPGQPTQCRGRRRQQHPVTGRRCEFGAVQLADVLAVLKDGSPPAKSEMTVAYAGDKDVDGWLSSHLSIRHVRNPGDHRICSMPSIASRSLIERMSNDPRAGTFRLRPCELMPRSS